MALTDKDIIITPNRGAASDPKIDFIGATASTSGTITMTVLTASGTTLAFTGTVGTLFQIANTSSTTTAVVSIPSTVNATGTTTGALVISGGVGIGQDLRVGGLIYGTLAGQVSAASQVVITNDITSSTVNFITFVNTSSGNAGVRTAASTGMVYVPSTGFVAIGTTNPTERLTVGNGNIQLDNNRAIKFKSVAGVVGNVLRFGSDNHTYLESPASGNIILRTGATLTDRLQILPSGYVGIGTGANSVTTAFPLHVYGDVSGGQIAVENGSGSTTRQAGINYRIDGADLWQTYVNNADSTNNWRIKYNNTTDYFTVDTSGNAGLGTVTPGAAIISPAPARYFEIFGNGGNPALRLNGNALNQTTIQLVAGVPNVSTSGFTILDETAGANRLSIDNAGRTSINTSTVGNNNFFLDVWGSIGASAGSITIGSGGAILPGSMYSNSSYGMLIRANRASPSQAQFLWQTSAGTEILRIDPNSNLGFGTTAAFEKFVMLGAANTATNPGMSYNMVINASNALTTATLSNVGAGIALGGVITGTTTATFAIISGVKENTLYNDTAGAFIIGTRANGALVTEKVRVTSGGLVGINTTPSYALDVKAPGSSAVTARLRSSSGDNNQLRFYGNTAAAELIAIGTNVADGGTGANFDVYNLANSTNLLRVSSAGNLIANYGYLKTTGGHADDSGGNLALQVLSPGGASTATTVATVTGAIKIRLPQGYTDTMIRMTVKVYTYNNNSFDITLGGYQNAGGSTWLNTFAYMNTTAMTQLNVRFGYDGTYNCIFIGETNSTWSYPQVFVTDFQAGYNNYAYTQWVKNWTITYYAGAAFANTAAGQYITKTEVAYPTWNKGGTNGLINVSQLTNDAGYLTSSNTIAKYTIGNNGVQPCWIYLGRWNTSQSGYTLHMTITAMQGYNASNGQDQFTEVFFKTSNGSSFQAGSSGNFYANGELYRTGGNTNGPQTVRVVQVDNNTYDFYAYFPGLVGQGSMYEITTSIGTWVNSSTVVTPTGNYLDLTWYTNYTSQSLTNLSQLNNDVPFYKLNDSPTFGTVTANSYQWNGNGSAVGGVSMLNMTHDSQTLFNGSTVLGDGVNSDLLAFNLPNTAEYYNGTVWSSTTVSTFYDAFRGKLSHRHGGIISLNSTTQQRIRFTWTGWGYKFWNGIVLAGSANGNNMWLTMETSADGTTWTTQINDVDIGGGWPNYNYIRNISNNSGSSPYLRITIRRNTTGANVANAVTIANISIIGSYGGYNNLFDWDYNRNVTFPGSVYAPTYYDSNNSNYYVDPASSSLVNTFTASGLLKGTYDGGAQGYTNWQIVASPAANGAYIAANRATASTGEVGYAWATGGAAPTWINYLPTSSTTLGWYAGAAVGVAMTLTTAGALNVTASVTSPIFYDRDDTTYYADPNSASRFNQLKLTYQSGSGLGTTGFNVAKTTLGGLHFNNGTGPSGNGVQAAITFMGDTVDQAEAGIYVHNNNSQGTHMAFATTDSYATGPQIAQYIYNTGQVHHPRSYVSAAGSFRAPIFYDSDNTGYYTDPASTSNINALDTAGTIRIQPGTGTAGSDIGLSIWSGSDSSAYGRIRFYQNQSNLQTIHAFSTAWQGGTLLGASSGAININGSNGVTFGAWNAISAAFDNSGNFYTRKWYDLDDQNYYVDPNGTTRLNNLQFAGALQGSVTHYGAYNSSNALLATPSGIDTSGAFIHFTGANSIAPYTMYRSGGDWAVPYGIGFTSGGESSGIYQQYASNGSSFGEMVFYTGNDGSGSFAWRRHTWESTTYVGAGSNNIGTRLMLLDWGQNLYVDGSVRSPIFYDQNNTGYYADPASTSNFVRLNLVGGNLYTRNPQDYGTTAVTSLTDAPISTRNYDPSAGTTGQFQPLTHQTVLYNSGYRTHVSTGIYKDANGWNAGWYMAIGGNDSYPTEWWQFRYGNLITNSYGYANIAGSTRSPLFYDLDDTGYYLDPNSSGLSLRIAGNIESYARSASWAEGLRVRVPTRATWGGIRFTRDEGNYNGNWAIGYTGVDSTDDLTFYGNVGGVADFRARLDQSANFFAFGSLRSPIWYDTNNTGYYVDGNNTTNLNALTVGSLLVNGAAPLTTAYYPWTSNRDFSAGTLVQTSIPMPDYGDPWVIEITGNSYDTNLPWSIQGQGYIYSATNINVSFISNGRPISGLQVIRYGGNLCFWWPRNGYWQGFTVKVYVPYATFPTNRVTSISDTGLPGGYDRAITPTIHQSYNTYNQANYDVTFNRVYSNTDMRAPIYYDSNNTGYYGDFNSTSNIYALTTSGDVNHYMGSGNRVRFYTTDSGPFVYNAEGTGATVRLGAAWGRPGTYSNTYYTLGAESSISFWIAGGEKGYIDSSNNLFMYGSMRAPIFYDYNDTGFYTDPNSISVLNILRVQGATGGWSLQTGPNETSKVYAEDARYQVFHNAPYYPHLYLNAYGDSGNTTHGPVMGMIGILTAGGYRRWSMGIANRNPNELSFGYFDNNTNPHYGVGISWSYPALMWLDTGASLYTTGSMRSPIFYDYNDTGYYMNPNSDSRVSNVYHTGWSRFYGNQGIYNQDYGVHFYGENSEGWGITGSGANVKLQFRSNHLSTTRGYVYGDTSSNFGFLDANGNWKARIVSNDWIDFAGSSARASIFYDRDDTSYYVNPNGDTYLYGGIWNNGTHGSSRIMNRLLSGNNGAGTGEVRLQQWCSEPGNSWDWAGFGYNVDNSSNSSAPAYYFGRPNPSFGQAYMRMSPDGQWYFYTASRGGTRYTHMYLAPGNGIETYGIFYNDTSIRAYIYYDRDNTGYYLDPNNTSNLAKVYMNDRLVFTNYGLGVYGTYTSTRYQLIFSMGESWTIPADGSNTGNVYGLLWSHPNAGGAASNLSSHGMILLENGGWNFAVGGGSARSTGDMRSPIFYDQNDTGYYCNPNSESNLWKPTYYTQQNWSVSYRAVGRSRITGDSNYWTNTIGWGTDYGNWSNYWKYGAGFFDCWGGGTDHPQGGGYIHTQGIQSGMHYATDSGGTGYGWQMVGAADQGSRWWLRGKWGGSTYSWYEIMLSGRNVGYTLYANIFYDSDNTGYYCDPNGTSNLNYVVAANGASYQHNAYNNNGSFMMNNASTWWGMMSNVSANDWRLGYGGGNSIVGWNLRWDNGSTVWANGAMQSPIYYDANNTGYYLDANSDSNVWRIGGYQIPRYNTTDYADAFRNTPAYSRAFHGDVPGGGPSGTWFFYDSMRHSNSGGYWGTQIAYGWEDNANNIYQRNISNNSFSGWVRYLNSGNYSSYNSYGSIYFTIGYDNNNSGYYIDPNSTSQLSYVLADNWFRPQGCGLYFQNYGYGIIQVNGYGSYGNVSTYGGGLNGWQGYNIQYGNTTFMGNGGTWGIYNAGGGWAIYGQPSNATVGINGGNNSSYALFVNGTVYATSNVYAYSDARSKENIITIDNALGKVTQLRGVYYNRTDRPEGKESGYTSTLNARELGVIAQEIMSIVPEAVSYSENTDRYGVNYGNLAGLLIEAIKDLKKELDEVRAELNTIKGN
jgi:hypothetical protein